MAISREFATQEKKSVILWSGFEGSIGLGFVKTFDSNAPETEREDYCILVRCVGLVPANVVLPSRTPRWCACICGGKLRASTETKKETEGEITC